MTHPPNIYTCQHCGRNCTLYWEAWKGDIEKLLRGDIEKIIVLDDPNGCGESNDVTKDMLRRYYKYKRKYNSRW